MDVIQASIPLFFALIGVELLVARLRRQSLYRLSDSIADLSCGTVSQLLGIFIAIGTITIYGLTARHLSMQALFGAPGWIERTPFPATTGIPGFGIDAVALLSWIVVFLLDDLTYYWVHRLSHEVNLLWAGHVVHHSSEEYNLTVALRQSGLHGLFTWVFYLPLAFLGVPVTMWIVCHGLNLIYQFWIHTREIDRLPGPVERVMNTPSHHRVHHGLNPQYRDKNYAGVFIVWDRLFGTFEPEVEAPVYGITKPLASWNPVWANLHVFVGIAAGVRQASRWGDKLKIVFGRPGWRPPELTAGERPKSATPQTLVKYDPAVPRALQGYAFTQFVAGLLASVALLAAAPTLPVGQTLAGVFYLILTLSNVGAILEGRAWAAVSELARLAVLAAAVSALLVRGHGPQTLLGGALVFALASAIWIVLLRPAFPASPARTAVASP